MDDVGVDSQEPMPFPPILRQPRSGRGPCYMLRFSIRPHLVGDHATNRPCGRRPRFRRRPGIGCGGVHRPGTDRRARGAAHSQRLRNPAAAAEPPRCGHPCACGTPLRAGAVHHHRAPCQPERGLHSHRDRQPESDLARRSEHGHHRLRSQPGRAGHHRMAGHSRGHRRTPGRRHLRDGRKPGISRRVPRLLRVHRPVHP